MLLMYDFIEMINVNSACVCLPEPTWVMSVHRKKHIYSGSGSVRGTGRCRAGAVAAIAIAKATALV